MLKSRLQVADQEKILFCTFKRSHEFSLLLDNIKFWENTSKY